MALIIETPKELLEFILANNTTQFRVTNSEIDQFHKKLLFELVNLGAVKISLVETFPEYVRYKVELTKDFFTPLHCQMDYGDNSITVQWEGEFSITPCINYLLKSYPNFVINEIISHSEPNEYKGFNNCGSTTFK